MREGMRKGEGEDDGVKKRWLWWKTQV